jgi:hypothetical protein
MHAELKRLTETWNRAWLEKDVAMVEKLMADGYVLHRSKRPAAESPGHSQDHWIGSYQLDNGTLAHVRI